MVCEVVEWSRVSRRNAKLGARLSRSGNGERSNGRFVSKADGIAGKGRG